MSAPLDDPSGGRGRHARPDDRVASAGQRAPRAGAPARHAPRHARPSRSRRSLRRSPGRHRAPRRIRPTAYAVGAVVLTIGLVVGLHVLVSGPGGAVLVRPPPHPSTSAAAGSGGRSTARGPAASVPSAVVKALETLAGPPGPAWTVTDTFGPSSYALNAVACASDTECFAVGDTTLTTGMVLSSSDGGGTWSQRAVPAGVGPLDAISCPAVDDCTAVGGTSVVSTTNGGTTWSEATVGRGSLSAVSCPASGECVVGDSGPPVASGCPSGRTYTTTDGGQTWTESPTPCFAPTGLACTTPTECVMTGLQGTVGSQTGEIRRSGDRATTWQTAYTLPGGSTQLNAVSCPTTRVCVAVGNSPTEAIVRSEDGGLTWTRQFPQGAQSQSYFLTVACNSATVCQTAGTGLPLSTTDAGQTWSPVGSGTDITKILGIACPGPSQCVGVAWDALAVPATVRLS